MKTKLVISCVSLLFILAGCDESELVVGGCGDEFFSGNSANTIIDFRNSDFVSGDVTATHSIIYSGGDVIYSMILQIDNVCAKDNVSIEITNQQAYLDSLIYTEAWITVNGGPAETIPVDESLGVHLGEVIKPLNQPAPSTVIISNTITFPSTFSAVGDSLRYDAWVDKQSFTVGYHEPK